MNLERTKPETLAAAALDLTPSHFTAAHEYAERLNAALARLGLTDRLTLPPAPNTAIDELPGVVDVPLRKTLSVLMGKAQQGDASALATLEWTAQVAESIFAGLHARDFAGDRPLALPSHESLATLSQGVDALLPRKISTGWSVASLLADPTCDGIDDGVSLVRLFCTDAIDSVTELKDDNEGWVWDHEFPLTEFPNLERISFNCISATKMSITGIIDVKLDFCKHIIANNKAIIWDIDGDEVMEFPELVTMEMNSNNALFGNFHKCKKLLLPKLSTISKVGNAHFCSDFPNLIELHAPNFSGQTSSYGAFPAMFIANPNLRWVRFGHFSTANFVYGTLFEECPNLIKFEPKSIIGSLNVGAWNPTMALRTDTDAEGYVDLREDMSFANNLQQFLSNFKTYIAERLTDKGSGLTLTLSQAVRDAIEGDPTIAQIITSKGWTISPAPTA